MELLAIIYIIGVVAYFRKTDERQRENGLLIMWALLTFPVLIALGRWLTS